MDGFWTEMGRLSRQLDPVTFVFTGGESAGEAFVQIVRHSQAEISLHRLWVSRTRSGDGSRALRTLCGLADRHGVRISLQVRPFGAKPYPMTRQQLLQWYLRHGFEGDGWKLARHPRGDDRLVEAGCESAE